MTLPRTVADVLAEHVVFEVECIDRMYLNVYVPQLQYAAGLVGYVHRQLGLPIASTAPLAKITDRFTAAVHRFARDRGAVGGLRQGPAQGRRDARAPGRVHRGPRGCCSSAGRRRRPRCSAPRSAAPADGRSYPWIVKSTGVVNHFYFYCVDDDFGPFFLKFCSYFPYNAKLCLNGNHWAKRQAAKAGIGFTALDNAFAAVDDPARLQAICDRLGPGADRRAAAQVAGDPAAPVHPRRPGRRLPLRPLDPAGRVLPDPDARPAGVRADLLRAGHPRQPRHRPPRPGQPDLRPAPQPPGHTRPRAGSAPGSSPTGVTPSLHVDYKHTTIKQYHKEGRALRTETTINDTRDFGIGKRLTNLPALREIGFSANRRLLGVQRLSHDPITGADALTAVTDPVITDTGTRIPGLRFADPAATPCCPRC